MTMSVCVCLPPCFLIPQLGCLCLTCPYRDAGYPDPFSQHPHRLCTLGLLNRPLLTLILLYGLSCPRIPGQLNGFSPVHSNYPLLLLGVKYSCHDLTLLKMPDGFIIKQWQGSLIESFFF